jgi:hypothetical protein
MNVAFKDSTGRASTFGIIGLLGGLLVVFGAAAFSTIRTLTQPDFPSVQPWQGQLLVLAVAVGMLTVGLAFFAQRSARTASFAWATFFALLIGLCATSGELLSLFGALIVLAASRAIGETVFRRCWPSRIVNAGGRRMLETVVVGSALSQFVLFAFGGFGSLRASIVAPFGAFAIAGSRLIWVDVRSALRIQDSASQLSSAVTALWCGLLIPFVVAPEIQYDALAYKEWLPALWADTADISAFPDQVIMNLAGSVQVLAVPGHLLGGSGTGRFLQLFAGLIIAFGLSDLRWMRSSWVVSLVVIATPHVAWQMTTAYDDLFVAMVAIGAVSLAWDTWKDPAVESGRAIVIGLATGGLASGKLHIAPLAVLVLGLWVLLSRRVVTGFIAGGLAALVVTPPFLIRWIDTGNPVFPQFNDIFRSRFAAPVNDRLNMPFDPAHSLSDLVKLPWRVLTQTTRYVEAVPDSAFGVIPFLVVLPIVLNRGSRRVGALVVLGIASAIWWKELRYIRYFLPVGLASLVMLPSPPSDARGASGEDLTSAGRRSSVFVMSIVCLTLVGVFGPLTLASFWNVRPTVVRTALGLQSDDEYLREALPQFEATRFLNGAAKRNDRVVGVTYGRLLFRSDIRYWQWWEFRRQAAFEAPNEDPFALSTLKSRGVRWVVANSAERAADLDAYQLGSLTPVWSRGGLEVFDIMQDEPAGSELCSGSCPSNFPEAETTAATSCEVLLAAQVLPTGEGPFDVVTLQGPRLTAFYRVEASNLSKALYVSLNKGERVEFRNMQVVSLRTPTGEARLGTDGCVEG